MERILVKGSFHLQVLRQGVVVEERKVDNRVVNVGLAFLAGALSGDTADATVMKYLGVGTDSTAAGATQTALLAAVETRSLAAQSRVTTTVTNDTYQAVATIDMAASHALREVGVFSAATDGSMYARAVFSEVSLENGDSLVATYKCSFGVS